MARRRKARPVWLTLPMWAMAGVLVSWGVWQASEFRRTLIAEGAAATESGGGAASAPAADDSAAAEAVDMAAPENDAWADAMVPAGEEVPVMTGGADTVAAEIVPADELLRQGVALLDEGRLVEGRGELNSALAAMADDSRAQAVREQLASLNGAVFLGSAILPEDPAASFVEVQSGDSFLKLGQKYAVPAALLEAVNPGLNPRNLKPETGVKVVQGPFHLRMFKSSRRVDLYARDMYVRSFPAEVVQGDYLPRGTYRVSSGTKIQVGKNSWIGIEGISEGTRAVNSGWLYGGAGPRIGGGGKSESRISGVKLADSDLLQLYNVLIETRSLLRVEP